MKKLLVIIGLILFPVIFSGGVQAQQARTYAHDVFDKIVGAINRDFPSPPRLEIVNNARMIAVTGSDGVVQISYQLIDKMRGFGADSSAALAHVLSHEIMHYYNEHFWAGQFALPYADEQWGEDLARIDADTLQLQYQETQADLYGIFYATNAGYATALIADAVIDSIYRWFELPYKLKNYPNLDDRKEIARTAANEVRALIPAYETAIMLLHLAAGSEGNEQLTYLRGAASFFSHITDNYIRTREMLNNIGVVKVMEALTYMNDTIAALQWPLIIETGSVLYQASGSRGSGAALPDEAARLLKEARGYFEAALEMEGGYFPAMVNIGIVYALTGKAGSLTDLLDEMDESATPSWLPDELQGLALVVKRDAEAAIRLLQAAERKGSATATANLQVANGNLTAVQLSIPAMSDITTTVDGQLLMDYFAGLTPNRSNRTDTRDNNCILFIDTIGNMVVMEIKFRFSNAAFRTLKLARLLPGEAASTDAGLRIGNSFEQMLKAYGDAYRISRESDCQVAIYPAYRQLFWFDAGKKVKSWAYYWAK
jgi:hypothetical protein